ncbi:alpha-amylase family glycosyl hydrolase [Arthrobacter sp. HMWF013]|uniref:alpha-amylase family glycosyl hydrolase n=1 Tax=Arthrobacter sp. HMWF013 TaxID=2056849 RepID=UPI000D3DA858|nr:alpha-amylase family glycosyl hydrolase [Arthrobacter sp. HMWF013]PTT70575.1 oligo-1,6-glucosidase [Arthrobacter sp. HMWF013]
MDEHNPGAAVGTTVGPAEDSGAAAGYPAPPEWLADAVIYEIYPQSFADSDGDGIGDLPGVLEHLDYLEWLGVDVIWFNPCFASPFRDAGYDVSDYLTIAPRYGTNADMTALVREAGKRGIRVLLDLVAGHTSVDHPWFRASMNDGSDHRYVWSGRPGDAFVPSPGRRPGWYLKNFFPEQPALNFGYARLAEDEPWRQLPDAAGPLENRAALREIIGYWLGCGVAGFRVDMAFSLVKDDPGLVETTALWRELAVWMKGAYPESVLLPESDEWRTVDAGARGGFDADFSLVIHEEHSALFNNGGAGLLPWQEETEPCYFDPDADPAEGARAFGKFLGLWNHHRETNGPDRLVVLPSADHDFSRLVCGNRTSEQLPAAFTFLLTWGSIPSIYFGDEIGMRYLEDAPEKEGSIWTPKYNRAGCRTPMQWDNALANAGFSTAPPEELYLPQDPDHDRPTVAAQSEDPGSLLHFVRRLVQRRKSTPALGTRTPTRLLSTGYPLVYVRNGTHLVVVNPLRRAAQVDIALPGGSAARHLMGEGVRIDGGTVHAEGFGCGVFELPGQPAPK